MTSLQRVALLLVCFLFAAECQANQINVIVADPKQCVALNKGEVCFQTVLIRWHTDEEGNYCVRSSQQQVPVKCWQNKQTSQVILDVESTNDVKFSLHIKQSNIQLAEDWMRVAWVYKQSRKKLDSWRLF